MGDRVDKKYLHWIIYEFLPCLLLGIIFFQFFGKLADFLLCFDLETFKKSFVEFSMIDDGFEDLGGEN